MASVELIDLTAEDSPEAAEASRQQIRRSKSDDRRALLSLIRQLENYRLGGSSSLSSSRQTNNTRSTGPRRTVSFNDDTILIEDNTVPVVQANRDAVEEEHQKKWPYCPICYEELEDSRNPTATLCGHVYCNTCIRESLLHRQSCPVCRRTVNRNQIIKLHLQF